MDALAEEEPTLVQGPAWLTVDLRKVATDHEFLAHTIGYYRDHPAARAGIGTAAGQSSACSSWSATKAA